MKNFILVEVSARKAPFLLLSLNAKEGVEVEYRPFTRYVEWLKFTKGYSGNTITQYAGHVARFIDFVYEASSLNAAGDGEVSTLIYWYQDFLLHAYDSEIKEVRTLCDRLEKKEKTSISSIAFGIEAALSGFIAFHVDKSETIGSENIFARFVVKNDPRTSSERNAIKKGDWLASTIRGSMNRAFTNRDKTKIFSISKRARHTAKQKYRSEKDYPLEKIVPLLSQKPKRKARAFHRDMALYSLLASSGCRTHEALQIRTDDIDFNSQKVFLRDPFKRDNNGLTPNEFDSLAWKGREREEVFMIAPFDSYFWYHLGKYIESSFRTNVNHNFIFQKSDGRPLFTTNRSDRNKRFKAYAKLSGFDASNLGLHSLRHTYGRYILNYLPIGNERYGLSPAYVQILMGHSCQSSTDKYAIRDTELLNAYIEAANRQVRSEIVNLNEIKLRYIESQQKDLEDMKKSLESNAI